MEAQEQTMEEKCENLMKVVVESRKRFGKLCRDYEHKTSLMHNKILKLQLDTISNYNFKLKNPMSDVAFEDPSEELDEFRKEVLQNRNRIEGIRRRIKNTEEVVLQLKNDEFNRRARDPLDPVVMLERAKHS